VYAKALGTLWHFGPLALVREVRAMARWRRLDDGARAAGAPDGAAPAATAPDGARDQNTA